MRAYRFKLFHGDKEIPFIGNKEPDGLKLTLGNLRIELYPLNKKKNQMKASPTNAVCASTLSVMLGMSVADLRRLADERSLPFVYDTSGWCVSRNDLPSWRTAALLAANEKENAA